ncbi:UPF0758 domain-containing protein, partial [Metallibacterium scheffleri]|uniref:UPF0758 domain-containing protein n=1 Tax=Metallibacterium scheffleri TaxID=993689 RepID=UPI0031BBB886|nr:hypothetical protein [Metallibacterium scheffleri]
MRTATLLRHATRDCDFAHMSIRDWPEDSRPRERLLRQGVASLAPAELIAVLLGSGTRGSSAVELGQRLLARAGSVSAL